MLSFAKKISYILDKRQKINLIILAFLIAIGSVLETVSIAAILPVVNIVTDPEIVNTNKWYILLGNILNLHDTKQFIVALSVILIIAYVIKNGFLILLYELQYRYITNNQRRVTYRLMQCYLSQDYLFHVSHNVAELQRNCGSDVTVFFQVLLNLIQLATELMTCGFLVVFLMMQDVVTTLFVFALMSLFLGMVYRVFRRKLTKLGERQNAISAEMGKWFYQSFQGIKEIKVSNKEQFFLDNYGDSFTEYMRLYKNSLFVTIVPRPLMEVVVVCGLLMYVAIRVVMGADLIRFVPTLSVFVVAAYRLLPSFNRISGCLSIITGSKVSIDNVYNDLRDIEGLRQELLKDNDDDTELKMDKGIQLENVVFYYPSKPDAVILDSVNLIIPPKKSVALIGPSGAGKTTLADVILGVLKPQSGHIIVGGVDIFDHLHAWHKHVGYIPQNIYLMDDTIRANVAFGYSKQEIDDEKVWRALEEAQLAEYLKDNNMDLDSNIGAMGVKLSGGQRQRIGIARALYNDPDILVLDEATSALDTDTETAVMESIYSFSGKRAMIIIAHRLTTIRNCDLVYEVRGGKVIPRDKEQVLEQEETNG